MPFVEHSSSRGSLIVSVHAGDVPQIEIYTSRGQSFVVEGQKAIEFAEWLKGFVADPILNPKETYNAD